ncbi:MAG: RAMP superfamily CRISPR-associated protein [Pseudomonadota bacterium]
MNKFMDRYYKRKTIHLKCLVVTPMFLGNADQDAEWRAAQFKALLRYWWRVAHAGLFGRAKSTCGDLLQRESELFGCAGDSDESEAGKSLVGVEVVGKANASDKPLTYAGLAPIHHPEMELGKQNIRPLLYLANMGLMSPGGQVKHSYFPDSSTFRLTLDFPPERESQITAALALIQAFGAIGGRCRNGWGSFQVQEGGLPADQALGLLNQSTDNDWKAGFEKDYPNCLGKDQKGPLLWKINEAKPTWAEAMRELADAYIGVRARNLDDGMPKLDPDGPDYPSERHLLGFPLTRHEARKERNWGNQGRHASPLRFVVHRAPNGYRGFVLHLPFRHSDEMPLPFGVKRQIEVWETVHRKLDHLLERAAYKDCL